MDFRWSAKGGVLLDGSGDIALSTPQESLLDIVRTRLQSDIDGWQLYRMGADLRRRLGDAVTPELEVLIKRQIHNCLTNQFLSAGQVSVETVPLGGRIDAYVYISGVLAMTLQIDPNDRSVRVL